MHSFHGFGSYSGFNLEIYCIRANKVLKSSTGCCVLMIIVRVFNSCCAGVWRTRTVMFLVSCTKSCIARTPVKDGERDFIWSLIQIERFIYKISCVAWEARNGLGVHLSVHALLNGAQ